MAWCFCLISFSPICQYATVAVPSTAGVTKWYMMAKSYNAQLPATAATVVAARPYPTRRKVSRFHFSIKSGKEWPTKDETRCGDQWSGWTLVVEYFFPLGPSLLVENWATRCPNIADEAASCQLKSDEVGCLQRRSLFEPLPRPMRSTVADMTMMRAEEKKLEKQGYPNTSSRQIRTTSKVRVQAPSVYSMFSNQRKLRQEQLKE